MGKALAIVSVVVVAFGVLLLSYAPATCACVGPAEELALRAGVGGQRPTPASLEAGLNRRLADSEVAFGTYPYSAKEGCELKEAGAAIVCRVPIDTSLLMAREYRVTYHVENGHFRKASVVLVRWPSP